ncbi:hypothetical protein LTR70_007375 [Exophiala xenobiotica]|uniref:Uncharacterized protein n=1 Tax=Lithohypha guttulata TaxID=1690604 RepID=A0ABR0K542_9EURO|nr:hypothetical protein LTR24_006896 [Lithohypha guttulata]KAK5313953.1 hypothetical protein LTR70_007375 [Exophiala xenobiotica]
MRLCQPAYSRWPAGIVLTISKAQRYEITVRFVDTNTLKFREIPDSELTTLERGFAILSHTWTEEEVLYQEMLQQTPQMQHKRGYVKLKGACMAAKNLGYHMI